MHVTEVESFLTTARRAGVDLSDADADAYYAEQRRVAALVGLDPATVPGSVAEVDAYFEQIRPQLRMTREAADTLLFLSAPPLPKRLGLTPVRLAWFGLAATAFGMLPRWAADLRHARAADHRPDRDAVRTRASADAQCHPHRVYEGPIYKAAMARAEKARASAAVPSALTPGTANASRSAPSASTPRDRGSPSRPDASSPTSA